MDADFLLQQQAAINRMREMNQKSAYYVKPKPQNKSDEVNNIPPISNKHPSNTSNTTVFGALNIPFIDTFLKEKDATLILGLLLILLSENSDRLLLLALVYILL